MNRKQLFLLALVFVLIGVGYLALRGGTYVWEIPILDGSQNADAYTVSVTRENVLSVADKSISDGVLRLTLRAGARGSTFVDVQRGAESVFLERFYVHSAGIITQDAFFGPCSGGRIISILTAAYIAALFFSLLRRYRADVRRDMYQYRNVVSLGLLLLLGAMLLGQILTAVSYTSLERAVTSVLGSANTFAIFALPVAFVLSIFITISNLRLMRREGRTWRNMLGCMLGVLLCLSTLLPDALSYYLQFMTTAVDVHNDRAPAMYLEMGVEQTVYVVVAYLECVLIGTVLFGFKAARHVPPFDRDYMLILGSQLRADGTLPPLLRARVDRAVSFASQQREATGKELTFVPSGGQGSDEIISEGDAMRRYLVGIGVPESRILTETESVNTDENIRNSVALIRSQPDGETANIAFSTTNYHVFRAGLIASRQGVPMEGVGAPTKRYFWVNAFVREFIATLYTERRTHTLVIAVMLLLTYAMIGMVYLSNTL